MGDPKRLRKKYSTPSHPWQKLRIDEEVILMKEYGFKNKKEIWMLGSKLSTFKNQIKFLISRQDEVAKKQKADLILKLHNMKLITENAKLEDILALSLKDLCERRLQTVVFKKSLARSIKQARQFITHEHIFVGDNIITSPAYLVTAAEEPMIRFAENSKIASEDHPERLHVQKELEKELSDKGIKKGKKDTKKEETKKEETKKGVEKPKAARKPRAPKKKVEEKVEDDEKIELPIIDELTPIDDEEI